MGAKGKLNSAYMNGALIIGVIGGIATGSFLLGIGLFAAMLASGVVAGNIRR